MLQPLSKVQNLKDPLKMFVATFAIIFPATSPLEDLVNPKNLELRCKTFGLPKITGDKTIVNWGGFERRYAGKQTRAGEWSVVFTEVWDSSITDGFKAWCNMYHNYTGGTISLLEAYTAMINVHLVNPDVYDPKPEGLTAYDMVLYDVFPTDVSYPPIDSSSSEAIEITVNFSYNYFLLGNENPSAPVA
jgi:hypothetical protein